MSFLISIKKKFNKASPVNKIISIIITITVVLVGFIILATYAATSYTSLEAETASRSSKVSAVADSSASGRQTLQFGSGVTEPAPDSGAALTKQQVIDRAGPRFAFTQNLSSAQAKAIIIETGLLERAKVTGSLNLSDVTRPYTIRDVEVDANTGLYGIRTRIGFSGVTPPTGPQIIEYTNIHNAYSAGLYIAHVTVRHVEIWNSIDGIKSGNNVDMYASYVHDLRYNTGAHVDALQIQYGLNQFFHWNVFDARIGYSTDDPGRIGAMGSGGLQTGSMNGDASARFHDNWWNGGHYTIRMGSSGPPLIDYQFRRNKHGRDFTYGPITGTTSHSTSYGGIRYDASNVWEDTGQPIRP